MNKAPYALVFVLALVAMGCSSKSKDSAAKPPVKSGTTPTIEAPTLPDELKNSAYEVYGLGAEGLMTYDVVFDDLPPRDGTQQTILEKVEDGKATYRVERTGGLAQLGVETIELRPEGAFTVASSMGLLKSPTLVVPADVAVGSTWDSRMDMDKLQGGDEKLESAVKNKALRTQEVKVPAGTYECLVVETNFEATVSGAPTEQQNGRSVTKSTAYFAKGVGVVKLEVETKLKDGTKKTMKIELKSVGDSAGSGSSDS